MNLRQTYLPLFTQFLKRDPFAFPYYLAGGKTALVRRAIREMVGQNATAAFNELANNQGAIRDVLVQTAQLPFLGWVLCGEVLYALVRVIKPDVVVETGVAAGVSTSFMLAALARNGRGELHSIDLPNYEETYFPSLGKSPIAVLPSGKTVGFLIPEGLRPRWHLHRGNTRELLREVLDDLQGVDIFLHDSEHTYETMMFEFETAWPRLKPGGLLLSDDVEWNNSFPDFCHQSNVKPIYFWTTGLAGAAKPASSESAATSKWRNG